MTPNNGPLHHCKRRAISTEELGGAPQPHARQASSRLELRPTATRRHALPTTQLPGPRPPDKPSVIGVQVGLPMGAGVTHPTPEKHVNWRARVRNTAALAAGRLAFCRTEDLQPVLNVKARWSVIMPPMSLPCMRRRPSASTLAVMTR